MEIAIVVLVVAAVVLVAVALRPGRDRPSVVRVDSPLHRSRAEAAADAEDHDIDDMLDAIAERRRRRGGRDVGEELGDELMRGSWDEE